MITGQTCHTEQYELLEFFAQISLTSHFPNQKQVHKQGEEIHPDAVKYNYLALLY